MNNVHPIIQRSLAHWVRHAGSWQNTRLGMQQAEPRASLDHYTHQHAGLGPLALADAPGYAAAQQAKRVARVGQLGGHHLVPAAERQV